MISEHDESNPVGLVGKLRLVLCSPRSGGTMLLRMLNQYARDTSHPVWCGGDYHPSLYSSIVKLHESLFDPSPFTKSYSLHGPENPSYFHPRMWLGSGLPIEYWRRRYFGTWHLNPLFNFGNMLVHKTTNLGLPCAFGDTGIDSTSDRFLRLLKDVYQDRLQIVFLTRPIYEILAGFKARPDSIQGASNLSESELLLSLQEQREFFKRHTSIFTSSYTHAQLVERPVEIVKGLGFRIDEACAMSIINNPL